MNLLNKLGEINSVSVQPHNQVSIDHSHTLGQGGRGDVYLVLEQSTQNWWGL